MGPKPFRNTGSEKFWNLATTWPGPTTRKDSFAVRNEIESSADIGQLIFLYFT